MKSVFLTLAFLLTTHYFLSAQLYTGTTQQFGTYSGGISIGVPLPSLMNNVNLYVERSTSGTAIFAGNGYNGNNSTAIGALSNYGRAIEAFTLSGYAIHGEAYDPSGYAGYFLGRVRAIETGGIGLQGESESGHGVVGKTNTGFAVHGISNGTGWAGYFLGKVQAIASNDVALSGTSSLNTGVLGSSSNGFGIHGISTGSGYAGRFEGSVWLDRIDAKLSDGPLALHAHTGVTDGAVLRLYPNSDPDLPGDAHIIAGSGDTGPGEVRFQNYETASAELKTNMFINGEGKVGIGASDLSDPDYRLVVKDGILTERVKVTTPIADYVFEDDWERMSLKEVARFIEENNHLPGVISSKEAEEQGGVELGTFTVSLQEKLEELYLHTIEMEEYIERLEKRIQELEGEDIHRDSNSNESKSFKN